MGAKSWPKAGKIENFLGLKWAGVLSEVGDSDFKVNGRDRRERKLRTRTPSPEPGGNRFF